MKKRFTLHLLFCLTFSATAIITGMTKNELERTEDLIKLKNLYSSFEPKTLSLASTGAAYLGYKGLRVALNPWPAYIKLLVAKKPEFFSASVSKLKMHPKEGLLNYFNRRWAMAKRLRQHLQRVHGHIIKGIRVGGTAMSAFYLSIASSLWKRAKEIRELQEEFRMKSKEAEE